MHVISATYHVLLAIELEVRKHLNVASARKAEEGSIIDSIVSSEDVLLYWSIVACNWEEEESVALLGLVADLYVTIRGFAFVCSCVELYKQEQKKTTQKSLSILALILPCMRLTFLARLRVESWSFFSRIPFSCDVKYRLFTCELGSVRSTPLAVLSCWLS